MKITDAFLGEHGVLYAQFGYLEKTVPTAATLAVVTTQAATVIATLASHAHLEDELLFSTLDRFMGPMGPVAVMRMDHEQIEGLLDQAHKAQDLEQAKRLLLQAMQVARNHFAKEEQILFRIAQEILDEETLDSLGAQWARRRGLSAI